MPSNYISYGRMSLEDASEELLKLIMFGKVQRPVLATPDRRSRHDIVLPKLIERAKVIDMPLELHIGHGKLVFPHGQELFWLESTYPERARGMNYDCVWMHNIGEWAKPAPELNASSFYELLMFGLRLGESPRILESLGD